MLEVVATPLFLVLIVVESTDVLFAVDSVPAIFGVVDQNAHYFRFVVFTSNVFAILGLRTMLPLGRSHGPFPLS